MTHDYSSIGDGQEIQFRFDELFFSRTDPAGIIQFGNSVFQRVAIYSWDELLGKPHKIVRHPDTPRAVFWALWDSLKRDQPIAAYVKNRAKDGRSYWVFAIATPVEGGHMSVRLRPSSALFRAVQSEYAALAAVEAGEQLTPAQSAGRLLARLAELGFADYRAFMAAALGQEMKARDHELGRAPDRAIAAFESLREESARLLSQADVIADAYLQSENVPFNFRVLAAQLGQEGAALAIISANYTTLSEEMRALLERFTEAAREVFNTINEGYFLACVARIQREMHAALAKESESAQSEGAAAEMERLERQQAEYGVKALQALTSIARNAEGFRRTCLDMSRLAGSLEVTRIMGKVECARHAGANDRMAELLNDLENFQKRVAGALTEIDRINRSIHHDAQMLGVIAKRAA